MSLKTLKKTNQRLVAAGLPIAVETCDSTFVPTRVLPFLLDPTIRTASEE
jgi:hypothetical protein